MLVLSAETFMVISPFHHVGHYPDLVSIAAHVIVDGLDQSVLEERHNL